MSEKRTEALLVTPLPPMETGLATYALRVLEHTSDFVDWTVAYPGAADEDSLPEGPEYLPIDSLGKIRMPLRRIFQLGNSVHCFPVLQALYEYGGTALFHETVLHHMMRHCYIQRGAYDDYRRELRFCYGPAADGIERELSKKGVPEEEFDGLLKCYPLIGRAVNASNSAACLNRHAARTLADCYRDGSLMTIGHPLSPLPELKDVEKPFPFCLGMIGGFHHGRNLSEVISAVRSIRKEEPGTGLLLIGGGYPPGLPSWVITTGRLPEALYQSWIRTLDIVLDLRHPTCGETSGSLLEAMRAGIPAIVSSSGSFINIPSDGVIRLPPDNIVQALPAAVKLLRSDAELRDRTARRALEYALDTGSVSRLVRDWTALLKMAGAGNAPERPDGNYFSSAPAWMEPPEGFRRDLETGPVTWKFSGEAVLEGPDGATGGWATVWGSGTLNGTAIDSDPGVVEFDGGSIVLRGTGRLSYVRWR